MKTKIAGSIFLLVLSVQLLAQQTKEYAVPLQAIVSENPAQITLKWPLDTVGTGYKVYKKEISMQNWGTPIATLAANATTYTDATVTIGDAYEYYVQRNYSVTTRLAHGYIYAGIRKKTQSVKGGMLLLVDANYETPLASDIAQLKQDLVQDGWIVKTAVVSRNSSVTAVKQLITSSFVGTPEDPQLNAIYILGHVPIPYTGGFVAQQGMIYPPDGHDDHGGAWASDAYYGSSVESMWTDNIVDDQTPVRVQNKNVPGDGKFDVMYLGENVNNVQIGRVDLFNMPAFGLNDTLLVKQYLQKAHAYKTAQTNVLYQGLIDDNWGALGGEAFAASAWRDFSTMFGDSVVTTDYLTSTKQQNYAFTYGGGPGSYTSCGGIGTTAQFVNDSINQIFTMLFGSYFGDWDSQDNLLRAPLATQNGGLASAWSGRPHWHFHHMALGENIGYSQRVTQNNYFDEATPAGYVDNSYATFIHINLMGDPSLRLHMRSPLKVLSATSSADSLTTTLSWQLVPGAVGYLISKAQDLDDGFFASVEVDAQAVSWTDTHPYWGYTKYMVRPIYLQQTPSGSYYNLGLGAIDSAYSINTVGLAENNPSHAFEATVYPNPTTGLFTLAFDPTEYPAVEVFDMQGKLIMAYTHFESLQSVDLSGVTKGCYIVKIKTDTSVLVKKVTVH